jgi:RNA polymerase sigma factor (sigma-70 family)
LAGSNATEPVPSPLFVTTRWSVVLAARERSSPESAAALETLCRAYWQPLYAYVRGSGHAPHDAQDLTQEFFARLLAKDYLQAADREKGRFRTFLRVCLKRFLANEWDRARAAKRGGGGERPTSLEAAVAEQRYATELATGVSPDRLYERQWAMALLEQTMARLRAEYTDTARVAEFEQLKSALTAERGAIPYAELAAALNTTEGAARVAVHRLRKRYRELFRAAVADTVSEPGDVDDEVRHIVGVLGGD